MRRVKHEQSLDTVLPLYQIVCQGSLLYGGRTLLGVQNVKNGYGLLYFKVSVCQLACVASQNWPLDIAFLKGKTLCRKTSATVATVQSLRPVVDTQITHWNEAKLVELWAFSRVVIVSPIVIL